MVACFTAHAGASQVVKVEVKKNGNKWELIREGVPYYIKGGGGQKNLDKLKEIGGNSFRTWSLDDAEEFLDEAEKRGLTVMMGLWVQHERHGFDYDDEIAVKKQLDFFTKRVKKLKDHPALLMWGIGNEVDLFYKNTKVWHLVQDIAKMIHEVDPNHPTSTVTAGLDSLEVDLIKRNCPDIDIYGVNTYGDLENAIKNIGKFGWTGPYMITEWGVNGHWEVAKTLWDAPIEQSSSQKAVSFKERYGMIAADSLNCLGSYAFLWGQKQETTATWYGLFSKNGKSTEAIDVLEKEWRGKNPANSCPAISSFLITKDNNKVDNNYLLASYTYDVEVKFTDIDGDKLKVTYMVVQESTDVKAGGDAENAPPSLNGLIKKKSNSSAAFKAPSKEGAYRLFVYAYDKNNHMAYVNIPFYVKPSDVKKKVRLKKRNLKFEY